MHAMVTVWISHGSPNCRTFRRPTTRCARAWVSWPSASKGRSPATHALVVFFLVGSCQSQRDLSYYVICIRYTSIYINIHQYTSKYINKHQYTSIYINIHQYTPYWSWNSDFHPFANFRARRSPGPLSICPGLWVLGMDCPAVGAILSQLGSIGFGRWHKPMKVVAAIAILLL
jgi:hypothetical protein